MSASLISDNSHSKRIRNFVDCMRPVRGPKQPSRGLIDVAFISMPTMQDTIARLRLSAYSPDVMVEVPQMGVASSDSGARRS